MAASFSARYLPSTGRSDPSHLESILLSCRSGNRLGATARETFGLAQEPRSLTDFPMSGSRLATPIRNRSVPGMLLIGDETHLSEEER